MEIANLCAIFENEYPGKERIFEDLIKPIFVKAKDTTLTSKIELSEADKKRIKAFSIIAQVRGGFPITFADVELNDTVALKRSRVNIQNCVRKIIANDSNAIIFFHFSDSKKEWRVSYCHRTTTNKESTSAKRYTYLCGTEHQCRTVAERFAKLSEYTRIDDEKLLDAFSLEALTEDFYKELFDWYEWAVETAKYPVGSGSKVTLVSENESKGENIIRLITRLMFVWFIKQKKLVPDWIFDSKNISEYLADFDENSLTSGEYYNAILQNLFFATLNKDLKERAWAKGNGEDRSDDYGVKTLYRDNLKKSFFKENKADDLLNAFKEVPFLNGGLFECLDNTHTRADGTNEQIYVDGFSREADRRAFVPNALFFQQKDGNKEGLLHILKRYNFTIEENSPIDVEIALDPELLGKVFENLLGVFNPETSDTARHETGSFYTPREIVNYMVDQSLKEYLKTNVAGLNDDLLDSIFESGHAEYDATAQIPEQIRSGIKSALKKVKVLDPACGSGAFPMGMLNRIVDIYKLLSHDDELTQKAIYNLKKEIIENCIYGVDIQPIAVQISKLRFFISLICEQEKDADEDNFGYYPLPNLETKFVAANTLVQLKRGEPSLFINNEMRDLKTELHSIREKHFSAKTAKEKHNLREQDKICRKKLAELLKSDNACSEADADQLADWNPYDQKNHAQFFDADWMFNMDIKPLPTQKTYEHKPNELGFDIVIGNPPYIEEGKNSGAFDKFRDNKRYYMGKMNIWYGFAQIGLDLLKDNGTLCFIAKNNWTTSSGAKLLRNQVVNDSKILQILDFNSYMIFKSAAIQTMIMMFKKDYASNNYDFDYRALGSEAVKEDMLDLLEKKQTEKTRYLMPTIKRTDFINKFLVFTNTDYIFDKIKEGKAYLYENEATNGIHPHHDFVDKKINAKNPKLKIGSGIFGLSEDEKNSLKLTKKELELVKPYYNTEQVKRYYTDKENKLWIIYTTSDYKKPDSMDSYPHLKKHLDSVQDAISSCNKPYGLHRSRVEHFFKGEKIVSLRKCVGKPCFSYSDFDCYVSATFYIIQTSRWNLKYLTGVLNSTLVAFWLKHKGKMQGENYQVDKEPLMDIPLPANPTTTQQNQIADLVDKILAAKQSDREADTSKLEREIDKLVYALYGITEQSDIDLIEGK